MTSSPVHGTALVDGVVAATWAVVRDEVTATSTMTLHHLALNRSVTADLEAEADRALRLVGPGSTVHRVVMAPVD